MRVIAVQLQDVHPPKEVSDAFKDVASAREDKSRIINEAEAYRNELIPKARGLAAEVENQAQAYKETRIRNAEGEANRFLALLKEYEQAKDVTKQRMYRHGKARSPEGRRRSRAAAVAAHAIRPVRREDCAPRTTFRNPSSGSNPEQTEGE